MQDCKIVMINLLSIIFKSKRSTESSLKNKATERKFACFVACEKKMKISDKKYFKVYIK